MDTHHMSYEGWISGINEWTYSKMHRLLENAFENVSYEYLEAGAGAFKISGQSPMFEEDEENRLAIFDLIAEVMDKEAKGLIVGKVWTREGQLILSCFEFSPKKWTCKEITLP